MEDKKMTSRQIKMDKQTLKILDVQIRQLKIQEKQMNRRKLQIMRTLAVLRDRYHK